LPVATKNMGWKLGYITSLDGTRVIKDVGLPGAVGTTTGMTVEEVGDELAEVAKLSEYDGGWVSLSKGVGKVGSGLESGWYTKLISGGCDPFSEEGAGNSRLSPWRPLVVFS
jgi:hypothetical protein